jgi:hypothetical protein
MADNTKQSADALISTEEITTLNGGAVSAQHVQRMLPSLRTADGTAVDVTKSAPLPVEDAGGSLTVDSSALGTTTDAEATGNGSIIGLLKRLRTLLAGGLPSALTGSGNLKVAVQENSLSAPLGVRLSDGASAVATTSSELHIRDATARTKLGEILSALGGVLTAEVSDVGTQAAVEALGSMLATIDADTGGMLTALQKLDDAIAGNEMQVDVVGPLPAGTNAIGKLAANSGVDIGDVDVASIAAGTNAIGNVDLITRTTGGPSVFRSLDVDETEESVKATPGKIYGYYFANRAAGERFLKIYNATEASVVVGETTPLLTLPFPEKSCGHVPFPHGIPFSTAITVAATTGIADNDKGAPGTNDVVLNLFYS